MSISHLTFSSFITRADQSVAQLIMIYAITKCRFITFSDNYKSSHLLYLHDTLRLLPIYSGVVVRSDKQQLSDKIRTMYF